MEANLDGKNLSFRGAGIYILAIPPLGEGEIFFIQIKKTGKNLKEDLKKERKGGKRRKKRKE